MATAALARGADHRAAGAPGPPVLWAIALAGCAAAAATMALALTSDHVAEPGLQAALMDWITLPYVVAGVIAWWRRPDSRFGPLMVAAGFTMFLSTLAWANRAVPFTIGQAFDPLPAVLFLHVFLAYPSGRLERRVERARLQRPRRGRRPARTSAAATRASLCARSSAVIFRTTRRPSAIARSMSS